MSRFTLCSTALSLIRETFNIKPTNYTNFEEYKQDFEMRMNYAKELLDIWDYKEEDAESVCSNETDDYDDEKVDSESVCGRCA